MESLSISSLAGVVPSRLSVITAIRVSTQRSWHTFNYDVTVSNESLACETNREAGECGTASAPFETVRHEMMMGI